MICTKNYQNLVIGFQVTVENVGDVFFGTQCSFSYTRRTDQWASSNALR